MSNRKLQSFGLDTPASVALLRRMKTPLVTTQAEPEFSTKTTGSEAEQTIVTQSGDDSSGHAQFVLIPADIYDLCSPELGKQLQKLGLSVLEHSCFLENYDEDQALLQELSSHTWQQDSGVFIVMEGWMVPLVDFTSYLQQIRAVLPLHMLITVCLLGRPGKSAFVPIESKDLALWKQRTDSLGDPYLQLISIQDTA